MLRLVRVLLAWFAFGALPAFAVEASPRPVGRTILALYDGAVEPTPTDTMIHTNAEMPLNQLGYILRYHDLRDGPPSPAESADAVAVVTFFTHPLDEPSAYLAWLSQIAETPSRLLMLGQFGVSLTPQNVARLNPAMARIGLRILPAYVDSTVTSKVVARDPAVIGFESQIDPVPPEHAVVERAGPLADVALEYETDILGRATRSIAAATGPGGGYIANGFALSYDASLDVKRWVVDPFTFFRRALGADFFPVPDPTTVSGRRLYVSHVDGDGWNNLSQASADRSRPQSSAEVMLERLIEPYPDLPVSVGLVGGDIDPELGGGSAAADVARRIYALPQVEVASHTMTHPFRWGFFDRYDRQAELRLVDEVDARRPKTIGQELGSALGLSSAVAGEQRRRFVAGSDALPRAYLRDPYDLASEVGGALRMAESLAPAGKAAAIYLWSGDTQPGEATIRATREAGVRNMNGGDVRFDTNKPSVGYVAPISRTVGRERQIYAVNSNENNYTKLWTDHFYGFRQLSETLERTERPRRLKGVDIYYHTYSAERTASLEAVKQHLDWARGARLAPIRASEYAAIADGFFSTEITALGPDRWRVANRDGLNTVRFDTAEGRQVDVARSRGVVGATRHAGSLYVALDAGVAQAVVALEPAARKGPLRDVGAAILVDSRWQVRDLERHPCRLDFTAEGYGPGDVSFEHLPARPMIVTARREGSAPIEIHLTPEADRPVEFSLPGGDRAPVAVSIACAGVGTEGL